VRRDPASWLGALPAQHPLVWRNGHCVSAAQIMREACGVRERLHNAPPAPVLLYAADAGYALIGLLGALAAGREVRLVAHAAPGYWAEIHAENAFVLSDDAQTPQIGIYLPDLEGSTAPDDGGILVPLAIDSDSIVGFYSSGTTGMAKLFRKEVSWICAEIEAQSKLWGRPDGPVLGTVSQQHIYGLLFRVFWPLYTGSTIYAPRMDDWSEIACHLTVGGTVVSSPAHLTRLPDELTVPHAPTLLLSSGAPLDFPSALKARQVWGVPVTELLGSSETGGIAWRRSVDTNTPFTPLPGVSVRSGPEDRLELCSPFTGEAGFVATGDAVTLLEDGRFRLERRLDRIAKIGGKRVALARVEAALKALPEIADACVMVHEGVLAAAVVTTPKGDGVIAEYGSFRATRRWLAEISRLLEPAEWPKRWRFVDVIPQNSQGKRTADILAPFFQVQGKDLPSIRAIDVTEKSTCIHFVLPPDLRGFDGHFPGDPILPGVVQLHIAASFAGLLWKRDCAGATLSRIKFRRVIRPKERVVLVLSGDDADNVQFRFEVAGDLAASGTLRLSEVVSPS